MSTALIHGIAVCPYPKPPSEHPPRHPHPQTYTAGTRTHSNWMHLAFAYLVCDTVGLIPGGTVVVHGTPGKSIKCPRTARQSGVCSINCRT